MLVFETKIKFSQYFLSSLGCFYIIPISYFCFFANKNNDSAIIFLGLIFLILGIVQFSYTLKSFHLYYDCLIVKRPIHFLKPDTKFEISEIDRIAFRQVKSKIGGGNYLIVFSNKTEKDFMLTYSEKILKIFTEKLKDVGIQITQEFKIN